MLPERTESVGLLNLVVDNRRYSGPLTMTFRYISSTIGCRFAVSAVSGLRWAAMVARQLVFYTYSSLNAKPPFDYPQSLAELHDKTAIDPNFAVVESNEATTAVTVLA